MPPTARLQQSRRKLLRGHYVNLIRGGYYRHAVDCGEEITAL
jgi:hypothetical protein